MLVPAEDEPLDVYPVVRLVNNVRNDGPELIAPLAG
jgi:putative SOS response-associated peptidase YedK